MFTLTAQTTGTAINEVYMTGCDWPYAAFSAALEDVMANRHSLFPEQFISESDYNAADRTADYRSAAEIAESEEWADYSEGWDYSRAEREAMADMEADRYGFYF
jgi:hypothetical protein